MPRHAPSRRLRLSASSLQPPASSLRLRPGLTLIEMLVALAITLLMMAAVVNLFANLSGSIRNRRAVIEVSAQLRQVRQRLALDLAGATCPATTWQTPGSDKGYIELVEGVHTDLNPSALLDGNLTNGEIGTGPPSDPGARDYSISIIPRNNFVHDDNGDNTIDELDETEHIGNLDSLVPGGVGDYDDILALTVQSDEPFVARHDGESIESHYAEVVWFAVENPAGGALGEPGLRSVYRRALLIAPGVQPIDRPAGFTVAEFSRPEWYFQRYDVSAHYDPTTERWVPNTLSDLTKRENRFYRNGLAGIFPHPLASGGAGYNAQPNIRVIRGANDRAQGNNAQVEADAPGGTILSYFVPEGQGGVYDDLPTIEITPGNATQFATARPVMAEIPGQDGVWQLAHVTFGPAPLSIHRAPLATGGSFLVDRTGEDLMLTDALAFDVRVYDPGAPQFRSIDLSNNSTRDIILEPGDRGWDDAIGKGLPPSSFGAYIDLGWDYLHFLYGRGEYRTFIRDNPLIFAGTPRPVFDLPHPAGWHPRYGYANVGEPSTYDTWSLHYESDGIDQDNIDQPPFNLPTDADEWTNGLDDRVPYPDPSGTPVVAQRDGPDDVGERETAPPYDAPLRGVQVRLRLYERQARQIRETSVTQSLVP